MLYVYQRSPNSTTHGDRLQILEIRLPNGNRAPRGVWSDGEMMWVVDEDDLNVYAMYYRDFRHTDDEVDIAQVNTPTGLWTDGEIMWAADSRRSDYGKLLAYNLSDQTRNSSKDVQLASFNTEPLSIWSDGETVWAIGGGQTNDFLYTCAMNPESDQVSMLTPYKSITLDSDNADPTGARPAGEVIWVSDSGDDKLYAYNLSGRSRQADQDMGLNSENSDTREIWLDRETVWVLDTVDKHVRTYRFSNGNRRKAQEFWTVPDNDDPDGGFTRHGLRLWVADGDDEKLYAYGKLNTPPSFSETSARLRVHRTIAAGDYVGSLPTVTDPHLPAVERRARRVPHGLPDRRDLHKGRRRWLLRRRGIHAHGVHYQ